MKTPLFRCTALLFTALALSACGKKDSASTDMAEVAETGLPTLDQAAPETAPEPITSVVKTPAAESDAAFLKEMKDEPAVTAPPAVADDRAAYEAWFKKYHLDLSDPTMLDADPDGDGANNRDEFLGGTNPRDATSRPAAPAAHPGIRLKEYSEVRLPIVLESVSGEKAVIRRTDGGEATSETVRAGDTLRGFPLRVAKLAERKVTDKDGNALDRSQIVLEDTTTKASVTLVKDLPAKTADTYAVLASEDGKTTVKVHAGEVFAWPGEPGTTYRVVDLGRDEIILQQQETGKMRTITRQ